MKRKLFFKENWKFLNRENFMVFCGNFKEYVLKTLFERVRLSIRN